MFRVIIAAVALLLLTPRIAVAAVGCSLDDPDSDIKAFFPSMTHYRVNFITFQNQSPERLELIRSGLRDELDEVYEASDVPYTLYTVDGRQGRLGYVFGANQRGRYGNIQVIAVVNSDLSLNQVYIQRLRSPDWELLKGESFLNSLSLLPMERFPELSPCYLEGRCEEAPADPTGEGASEDYRAILRALAKLHLIAEHLLSPGDSPAPRSRHARAEWISNYRGPALQTSVLAVEEHRSADEANAILDRRAPIFIWRVGDTVRGYPLATLHRHPVIEDTIGGLPYTVTLGGIQGNPVVLDGRDGRRFRPTTDLLFGSRLIMDLQSGSHWSPTLGEAVYGLEDGARVSHGRGGFVIPWSLAHHTFPEIEVAVDPNSLDSWPDYGELFVVRRGGESPAWRISSLPRGVTEAQVDGAEAMIVRHGELVVAWERVVDGRLLTFEAGSGLTIRDRETGSTWSIPRGEAIDGPLAGARLTPFVQLKVNEEEWRFLLLPPGSDEEPR